MVLRLDPRLPIVWRSPDTVQIGVAPPIAVFHAVSRPYERMLAALAEGISESGLRMTGRASGASEAAVDSFCRAIAPALEPKPRRRVRVRVEGSGPSAHAIAAAFDRRDSLVRDSRPDFVVIVSNFVVAPELHTRWLRRDIPHLAVTISDSTVEFSPIVVPGRSPCLVCFVA